MLIAQLSDTHVLAPDDPHGVAGADVDPNAALAAAVAAVNALDVLPALVLVTGDLTDNGTADEYAHLGRLLEPLVAPWRLVIGNHDERDQLLATFGGGVHVPPASGFIQYAIDDAGPLRVVAVDTNLDGRHDGGVDDERLAWLDATLAAAPDRPTVVAMHHPPFDTGIFWMDGGGFNVGRDAFVDVLARHPQVVRVICGHLHRAISAVVGGVPLWCAPSTAHQVELQLDDAARPAFTNEQPGFALHWWDGTNLITHVRCVDPGTTFVLEPRLADEERWARAAQRLRERRAVPKRPRGERGGTTIDVR